MPRYFCAQIVQWLVLEKTATELLYLWHALKHWFIVFPQLPQGFLFTFRISLYMSSTPKYYDATEQSPVRGATRASQHYKQRRVVVTASLCWLSLLLCLLIALHVQVLVYLYSRLLNLRTNNLVVGKGFMNTVIYKAKFNTRQDMNDIYVLYVI